ncbi:MAG: DUF6144 family protein [Oscillospiraceae bacterium]
MPKNDNVKSLRLYESVKTNIGEEAADKMAEAVNLSKSADFKRNFKWANDVCNYLESNFDAEQVEQIRMGCSCTPPKYMEAVKKLYQSAANLDVFCEKYNAIYADKHSVWNEDEAIFFAYPTCYCDCTDMGGV